MSEHDDQERRVNSGQTFIDRAGREIRTADLKPYEAIDEGRPMSELSREQVEGLREDLRPLVGAHADITANHLARTVAAMLDQARAEALREAADAMPDTVVDDDPCGWLYARADALARHASETRADA